MLYHAVHRDKCLWDSTRYTSAEWFRDGRMSQCLREASRRHEDKSLDNESSKVKQKHFRPPALSGGFTVLEKAWLRSTQTVEGRLVLAPPFVRRTCLSSTLIRRSWPKKPILGYSCTNIEWRRRHLAWRIRAINVLMILYLHTWYN